MYNNDSALGMKPFSSNRSFIGVAMDDLFGHEDPEIGASVQREVMELVKQKAYPLLPLHRYHITEAKAAFDYMSNPEHIGKIVLYNDPERILPVHLKPVRAPSTSDKLQFGAFIVTGGLGGLGQSLLRYLMQRGANKLAIFELRDEASMIRNDRTNTIVKCLDRLRSQNCKVEVFPIDVTNYKAVQESVAKVIQSFGSITGVFHLAGRLNDQLISNLTSSDFYMVCAPKILGAWNLHTATLPTPTLPDGTPFPSKLRFFVLFSSVAAILGQAGQFNYASASAFLNDLAQYRRRNKLPVTCINWGPLSGAGMMGRNKVLTEATIKQGINMFTHKQMLASMHTLIDQDVTIANSDITHGYSSEYSTGVVAVDWDTFFKRNSTLAALPRFAFLSNKGTQQSHSAAAKVKKAVLAEKAKQEEIKILIRVLTPLVTAVTGYDGEQIPSDKPLIELDLDSTVAVEFRTVMDQEMGFSVPIVTFVQGGTIE